MALDREAIFDALFARFVNAATWNYTSRINLGWTEALQVNQPALFVTKGHEQQSQTIVNVGLPFRWKLSALVTIFCRNTDPNVPPSIQLNTMIQAVEAALELQPGESSPVARFQPGVLPGQVYTTLGGLVALCQIAGEIVVWEGAAEGTASSQAVASIPIEMLVLS